LFRQYNPRFVIRGVPLTLAVVFQHVPVPVSPDTQAEYFDLRARDRRGFCVIRLMGLLTCGVCIGARYFACLQSDRMALLQAVEKLGLGTSGLRGSFFYLCCDRGDSCYYA